MGHRHGLALTEIVIESFGCISVSKSSFSRSVKEVFHLNKR